MPQSLVKILVHVVFSTKDRVDLITPNIEEVLFGYISGIVKGNNARLIIANGTRNHIHLLMSIGRIDIGVLIGDIKRDSSLWIKKQGHEFADFYWQRGYGAFSIGQSQISDVSRYIRNQKEHHLRRTNLMKMNFENYADGMKLKWTSDIVGIDLCVAFSDGFFFESYLGFHSLRSLHPRL